MLRTFTNGAFRASMLGRQPTATLFVGGAPLRGPAAHNYTAQTATMALAPPRASAGRSVATGARRFGTGRTTLIRGPLAVSRTSQGLSQRAQKRTFNWTWSRRSGRAKGSGAGAEAEPQSLSARLRKLSREYGWVALGVYLGLSVLDFPFCFLLVRMVGTERIAEAERWVMDGVKKIVPESVKERWHEYRAAFKDAEKKELGNNHVSEDVEKVGWGVEKAQEKYKEEASKSPSSPCAAAVLPLSLFRTARAPQLVLRR
jgi:N-terminal acetyltransferase 2